MFRAQEKGVVSRREEGVFFWQATLALKGNKRSTAILRGSPNKDTHKVLGISLEASDSLGFRKNRAVLPGRCPPACAGTPGNDWLMAQLKLTRPRL